MGKAHFIIEDASGRKMEGDIEALAIQDLKKGTQPDQFLSKPEFQRDGNFDIIVKDGEGNLKHLVASNTDDGAKQIHKLFKTNKSGKPIAIFIGQHAHKLISMDDGSGTPSTGSA